MKIGSIRMLGSFRRELQNELLSFSPEEGAAFFAAKYFETRTKIVLLADKLIRTRETDYLHKSSVHLEVSPIYLSRVLNVVEDLRNTSLPISRIIRPSVACSLEKTTYPAGFGPA